MLEQLEKHLASQFPFLEGKKLLLAVSGGLDSMVLTELFGKLNYDFAMAHCNFQLRGTESFEDEQFVVDYADAHHITVFTTKFDTQGFADDYKLSIQVAARELRYNWFYELLEKEGYDYLLTAHHADDNLETFLINFSRGTGLEGLKGIPACNEQVIRPLLLFTREDIERYALESKIAWREDSSNASDKYLRNKIRHELVPLFKSLNPSFMNSFRTTQLHLQEAQGLVDDAAIMVYQQVASEKGDALYFDLKKLQQLPNYAAYLFQWLKAYGFTAWADIEELVNSQSGKQILSKEFRLLKDRDRLILTPLLAVDAAEYWIEKQEEDVNFPLKMRICKVSDISSVSNSAIFVDEEALRFPLQIRKWKQGDVFYPLGMQGQSKKVSKFFKDEKRSLVDKENQWLLCSDNQIVWVIGLRQDERFKIKNDTKMILKIEVL